MPAQLGLRKSLRISVQQVQHVELAGAQIPAVKKDATGLPKESVANVSQLLTLDKADLAERTGKFARSKLELVLSGIDAVLGR